MAALTGNCLTGMANDDLFKPLQGSGSGSKESPISPLDLGFEKKSGVTVGLGIVPYLARLWLDDPYERRIVFGINMGVDHCSRSVVEGAKIHAFEANYPTSSPSPFPALILSPSSTPSSLLSPVSDIPQIGSPFDTDRFLEVFDEYVPLDPEYYLVITRRGSYEDNHSLVFDMSVENHTESEDLHMSGESMYGSFDEKNSHLDEQEERTRVVAQGSGYKTVTTHICNCSVMEPQPPRRAVGGLTALFGNRTNRGHNHECQLLTEEVIMHCRGCLKPIILKVEYPYCSEQCCEVDTGVGNNREK